MNIGLPAAIVPSLSVSTTDTIQGQPPSSDAENMRSVEGVAPGTLEGSVGPRYHGLLNYGLINRVQAVDSGAGIGSDLPVAASERVNTSGDQAQYQKISLELTVIRELSARDRDVRNHERAHVAAGGQYVGSPSYQYQRGPDGVNYAIAGQVIISTASIVGNPEATIEKAQLIRRAALAPAEPSNQDRLVAAKASQMEMQARVELARMARVEGLAEADDAREREERPVKEDEQHDERTITDWVEQRLSPDKHTEDQMRRLQAFHLLSNQLSQQIVSRAMHSQAPRPGQIISHTV